MDRTKKRRGNNDSHKEQGLLIDLVKKYVKIIENKETNAEMSQKKRITWNEITQRYNAVAVTGSRNWIQLRNLYENLKQRRKREILKERQQLCFKDIDELKKMASSEKKTIPCTNDGTCANTTNVLTENDKLSLAMLNSKVEPMEFGIELTVSGDNMDTITVPAQSQFITKNEVEKHIISATGSCKEFPDEVLKKKQLDMETSYSSAKEEYFRLKLSNAKLERKFLIQRQKMEKEKYKLQLEILHLKKQKLL